MDPNTLGVAQLKNILRQRQLSTAGRKVELVARLQQADPSGAWICEAAQQPPVEDDVEYGSQDERAAHAGEVTQPASENLFRRETELLFRERDIMQREIELLPRK
ncbi:unnamed protein product [Lasius platythorax]|uniref:SAP domain-containing protein n=1 Tax=Lasius platythorax TaxID=488582 RepID=A0AAV2MY85_9HYME